MADNSYRAQEPLSTERLRLIPLTLAELVLCSQSLSQFERQLGVQIEPGTFSAPVLRACNIKIEKMHHVAFAEHLWHTYWLVVTREMPRAIGCLGFKGVPDAQGAVEIGYGIADAVRGKGYGAEAVRALVDWALSQPACQSVWGDPLKTNEASNRLLASCGARLVDKTQTSNIWRIER